MRVALHANTSVDGIPEAARTLLRAVPGIEIVDLDQPEAGLMGNYLRTVPTYMEDLHRAELQAAAEAGVDALVAVYHADHRELCGYERDWPFQVLNVLEIIGASMGLHQDDQYKRIRIADDADAVLDDCADLVEDHGLDRDVARKVVQAVFQEELPVR